VPTSTIVRSVAHYVPQRIVTNGDLSKVMDTSDEWIVERTGIHERRFIEDPSVSTSQIATKAAQLALQRAKWDPGEIDLIIVATLSPDFYFPGVGVLLQTSLGCKNVPALDIRAQCSGFVYGISCADAFVKSGQARKILLVCAEIQSPVLDITTRGRDMAVLFGDGAAALALEGIEGVTPTVRTGQGVIDSALGSDGSGAEVLCMKLPGTARPGFIQKEDFEEARLHPFMEGRVVFKNAIARLGETANNLLARNNLRTHEIDLLVPHQANLRINEMVREQLGLPPEKVFNNIQKYGNTTAATIPICLAEAVESGRLREGMLIMTLAFGAGFTWGGNLIRW
jgi:3-oxoacyl-[acyl-carrier-protein] synthase-3